MLRRVDDQGREPVRSAHDGDAAAQQLPLLPARPQGVEGLICLVIALPVQLQTQLPLVVDLMLLMLDLFEVFVPQGRSRVRILFPDEAHPLQDRPGPLQISPVHHQIQVPARAHGGISIKLNGQ